MNTPFLYVATRSRRFYWATKTVRGTFERLSGFFLTEEAAVKWFQKKQQEDPAFGLR